ncbi:MAG: hypothetical protein D6732_00225 [Methanobacteriota archaeon]|nr:MAG: hypothetical protein D6732_00225 [Euryarchaeota archaeon]
MHNLKNIYDNLNEGRRVEVVYYNAGRGDVNYVRICRTFDIEIDPDELFEELVSRGLDVRHESDGEFLEESVTVFVEKTKDGLLFDFEVTEEHDTTFTESTELSNYGKYSKVFDDYCIDIYVYEHVFSKLSLERHLSKDNISNLLSAESPFIITDKDIEIVQEAASDVLDRTKEIFINWILIENGILSVTFGTIQRKTGHKPEIFIPENEIEYETEIS